VAADDSLDCPDDRQIDLAYLAGLDIRTSRREARVSNQVRGLPVEVLVESMKGAVSGRTDANQDEGPRRALSRPTTGPTPKRALPLRSLASGHNDIVPFQLESQSEAQLWARLSRVHVQVCGDQANGVRNL
jgi:hypothetical protein